MRDCEVEPDIAGCFCNLCAAFDQQRWVLNEHELMTLSLCDSGNTCERVLVSSESKSIRLCVVIHLEVV